MSIKDRLAKKMEGLAVPEKKSDKPVAAGPLRTSPGQMLMVNALTKENTQKIAQLEERLQQFEGALPVRLLPTASIVPSRWANRIEESFAGPEFQQLKDEIQQAGGNVQPIKVRPLQGQGGRYEIVFGHRRFRACDELGLPVLAMVEEVSDQDLFAAMDRENRLRHNLSPWEQGRMYRRALAEGLFPSISELARQVGVDKGNLSKALALADLPEEVVAAFRSPLELQYRWAKLLNDALQKEPDGVLQRARDIAAAGIPARSGKEVLLQLVGTSAQSNPLEAAIPLDGYGRGRVVISPKGTTVELPAGALAPERLADFVEALRSFFSK